MKKYVKAALSNRVPVKAPPPSFVIRNLFYGVILLGIMLSTVGSLCAAEIRALHSSGEPAWIEGKLGEISIPNPAHWKTAEAYHAALTKAAETGVKDILARHLRATGEETVHLQKVTEDEAGRTHLSFVQRISGLEVVGSGFRIHLSRGGRDAGRNLRRTVEVFNGRFYPHGKDDYDRSKLKLMDFDRALATVLKRLGTTGEPLDGHELVLREVADQLEFAYRVTVDLAEGDAPEIVYIGAIDGSFLGTNPTMIPAGPTPQDQPPQYDTYHQTFIARTSLASSALPPYDWLKRCDQTIVLPFPGLSTMFACTTADLAAKRAQDNQVKVYRYYTNELGRQSYDGANADLDSITHWGVVQGNPNNAYWNSNEKRMYYGEGDGSTFFDFTLGFDVAAHEFTHAVTEDTSELEYEKQSGALNEAMSDIFAAAIESWDDGAISLNTWLIGEDIVGPGFSGGQALRYMYNPGLDGNSPDHFSNLLYPDPCIPHSGNDYCGVHYNSGIANLAFYLLVKGGLHPAQQLGVPITGIGMEKAAKIFYYANLHILNQSDTFSLARAATETAAAALYDTATVQSVSAAWNAVGVY